MLMGVVKVLRFSLFCAVPTISLFVVDSDDGPVIVGTADDAAAIVFE